MTGFRINAIHSYRKTVRAAIAINATECRYSSARPIEFDFFRGSPARFSNANVRVFDRDGVDHFNRAEGSHDEFTLSPGASLTYQINWSQVSRRLPRRQVDAGFFVVNGALLLEDGVSVRFPDLPIEIL